MTAFVAVVNEIWFTSKGIIVVEGSAETLLYLRNFSDDMAKYVDHALTTKDVVEGGRQVNDAIHQADPTPESVSGFPVRSISV